MSVERNTRAPPAVETVMTIWQETLNEAHLTIDQALSAAAMMMGITLLNSMPDLTLSHMMLNDLVPDIHLFVDQNWPQVVEARQKGKPVPNYANPDTAMLPGTAVDELKRFLDQAGLIHATSETSSTPGDEPNIVLTFTAQEFGLLQMALEEMPYRIAQPLMDLFKLQVKP